MKASTLTVKQRLLWLLAFFAMIFLALIARLFYIQVIDGARLQQMALSQWTTDTSLTAARGRILDSEGVVLAQSGTAYKILLWPQSIMATDRNRVATELAKVLDMDYGYVLAKVSDTKKQEIVLKRQVERSIVDEIITLKLGKGVVAALDTKRYYPSGTLLSQILGFTTIDGMGQSGLELAFDKYLTGLNGRMITETDRKGRTLAYGSQEYIEPVDGYDLVLTTNSVIQSYLEKALEEAQEANHAKSAQGIILNAKTGAIVAISTKPDYDPNTPPRDDLTLLAELSKNRIVTDAYEPGSTFKIVTLASALDSGAIDDSFSIHCPGYYIVNGERIKCWKTHGSQDLTKAVQNSCNPAFMKMALAMGTETFYDYIYNFGFGDTTGSGLPGESKGIVISEKYVRQNNIARIGFGQSVSITPIQLASAASAAINGGKLMQPYIVDQMISADGIIVSQTQPTVVRQVISEETSAKVRELLEGVVASGSGRNAQIPGYRVGGKTGTAQKYEEGGGVAQGKLIASFIGFVPADDPEYVCLILVDEPQVGVIFGSTVAAPFVKVVLEETLHYYGFLPETEEELVEVPDLVGLTTAQAKSKLLALGLGAVYQQEDTVLDQIPRAGETLQKGMDVLLYTELTTIEVEADSDPDLVTVPDLLGDTRLEANDELKAAGLTMKIDPPDQTGEAIRQKPQAGTKVEFGSEVLVEFADTEFEE